MHPTYPWKNLVFEGGGVKGVAHLTAVKYLLEQNALLGLRRIAGTSAGAIQATLLAIGHSPDEIISHLRKINFEDFKDGTLLGNLKRFFQEFGLYKGDIFKEWLGDLVAQKLGHKMATFQDLQRQKQENGSYDLYLVGTNLSRRTSEVFSHETTPEMPIVEAARISMSFPFFFRAVQYKDDLYCDGGLLRNYPVRIFDEKRYIVDSRYEIPTDYYHEINLRHRKNFIFNAETLGFRVDSEEEIAVYNGDVSGMKSFPIKDIFEYTKRVISVMSDAQELIHLNSNDWHRTVYISSKGVGTLDFDLFPSQFEMLCHSGREYAKRFLSNWTEHFRSRSILLRMKSPPEWFKNLSLKEIDQAARTFGIDFLLVAALIQSASKGNPYLTQYHPRHRHLVDVNLWAKELEIDPETEKIQQQTSWGLLQIMGGTAREMGFDGPLPKLCEAETNLLYGCKKLKACLDRHDHNILDGIADYKNGSAKRNSHGEYPNEEFIFKVKDLLSVLVEALRA